MLWTFADIKDAGMRQDKGSRNRDGYAMLSP